MEFKSHSHSPLRILIADDSEDARLLLKVFLRGKPFEIDSVSNGAMAVALAEKQKYALILLDLHMPGVNGVSAVQEIRKYESIKQKSPVPVYALSASTDLQTQKMVSDVGFTGFLAKPLKKEALLELLAIEPLQKAA